MRACVPVPVRLVTGRSNQTLLSQDSHTAPSFLHSDQASLNPEHTAIHPPAWDDPERLASDKELSPSGAFVCFCVRMVVSLPPACMPSCGLNMHGHGSTHTHMCDDTTTGRIRGYLQALLDAEGTVPEFVRTQPFEAFHPHPATATAALATPVAVMSAAAIEAGLLPAAGAAGAATVSTPELDYHRLRADQGEDDEDEDDEDEIVLAPALAGLSLRPA